MRTICFGLSSALPQDRAKRQGKGEEENFIGDRENMGTATICFGF